MVLSFVGAVEAQYVNAFEAKWSNEGLRYGADTDGWFRCHISFSDMCVLSRMLAGSAKVEAFDWCQEESNAKPKK